MENKLSYGSLVPHITNMRACGLYPVDRGSPAVWRHLHTLYRRMAFIFILLYIGQQMVKVYQTRAHIDKAMDTMFLFLTHTDSVYKQIVIWASVRPIEELLQITKGPVFNKGKPKHNQLLRDTIREARLCLRAYNIVATITCCMWVLYAVVLYEQGNTVEFAIWLPFDPNAKFWYVVIYVWIQTTWVAFSNTTMDCFIASFFSQCKTQLSILREDLENLVAECMTEKKTTNARFEDILERRFKDIIGHHQQIVIFANKVQGIFGGPLLYQFLASGWIICFAAYRAVQLNPGSIDFISMIMYITCILVEVLLFCYFGNEVYNESQMLVKSAYEMDWLQIPANQRRALIIFMVRVQQPIQPLAGVVVPLSNTTFVSACARPVQPESSSQEQTQTAFEVDFVEEVVPSRVCSTQEVVDHKRLHRSSESTESQRCRVVRSSFSFYAFLDNTR